MHHPSTGTCLCCQGSMLFLLCNAQVYVAHRLPTMSAPFRFAYYNPAEIKVFSQALYVHGTHCYESLEMVTIRPTIVTTTNRAGAAQSRGNTEPGQQSRGTQSRGSTEPSNTESGQYRSGATHSRATEIQDNTDPGQERVRAKNQDNIDTGQHRA